MRSRTKRWGVVNGSQFGSFVEAEDNGVHEASGPRNDGSATAGTAQDGDVASLALLGLHFLRQLRGSAHNHHGSFRLPESEHLAGGFVRFGLIEEGFVEGEVLGGGRQCQFEQFHTRHSCIRNGSRRGAAIAEPVAVSQNGCCGPVMWYAFETERFLVGIGRPKGSAGREVFCQLCCCAQCDCAAGAGDRGGDRLVDL